MHIYQIKICVALFIIISLSIKNDVSPSARISVIIGNVVIYGVYLSPGIDMENIGRYLRKAILKGRIPNITGIVMVGDFNSNLMTGDPRQISRKLEYHMLKNISPINTPTTNLNTQLDLAFATIDARAMVYKSVTSYHKPVMATVNFA